MMGWLRKFFSYLKKYKEEYSWVIAIEGVFTLCFLGNPFLASPEVLSYA